MKITPPENPKFETFKPIENCARCLTVPAVSNHLCERCYTEHCQWLSELSAPKQDDDQWYTLYESGAR